MSRYNNRHSQLQSQLEEAREEVGRRLEKLEPQLAKEVVKNISAPIARLVLAFGSVASSSFADQSSPQKSNQKMFVERTGLEDVLKALTQAFQ